jgi:hypothetical protein
LTDLVDDDTTGIGLDVLTACLNGGTDSVEEDGDEEELNSAEHIGELGGNGLRVISIKVNYTSSTWLTWVAAPTTPVMTPRVASSECWPNEAVA